MSTADSRLTEYVALTRRQTASAWTRLKKWFLAAAAVGILVGLAVTGVHYVAYDLLWRFFGRDMNPVAVVLVPTIGLTLSGLSLQFLTKQPGIHGTEEVIEAFHERGGRFSLRSVPGKLLAAVATLGFGGSAGLEGPSIYTGAVIGSWLVGRLTRFGFADEDVRTFMVAGSAAGVSAIFKAPLTGVVFALEVPYMDDITREALIPSLIASVSSYLVLVQFLGVEPLFHVSEKYTLVGHDLLYVVALGVLVGIAARVFIGSYKLAQRLAERSGLPLFVRTGIGGVICGLCALGALAALGEPTVLGPGYEVITGLVAGNYDGMQAFWVLAFKVGAIVATLGSGGAGGVFIPLIMLGAGTGVLLKGVLPGATGPLFPIAGMAAFLAAGYNTPIAAAVFIAESTGGSGYMIPGLVAAAVGYAVAGRVSVSSEQRWRRERPIDRTMRTRVEEIMTRDVIAVPPSTSVQEFVGGYVIPKRHKSFPVADGDLLAGMVALSDVNQLPRDRWGEIKVEDVMVRDVAVTTPDAPVGAVVELMDDGDYDRIPVVDEAGRLAGIISTTDVIALGQLHADWRRRSSAER